MANKNSKVKYIILLVIFTVIFFIGMSICVVGFRQISADYMFSSLKGRLDRIEEEEKFYGPDHVYSTIMMDDDYEEEFDSYWEIANMKLVYIRGRYADDPSKDLSILKEYVDSCKDSRRKALVEDYISKIENRK